MAVPAWLFSSLASLGALYVSAVAIRFLSYLALILRRPKDLRCRYGAWAVVTGPTAGIGRSMSLELARRGLNLVLVGRDPAKLRDISETISSTHAVQTRTVLFDFSLVSTPQGEKAMRRLREAVEGLDVGVLVNNAGVAKPGAVYMHEADVEAWVRMIRVNLWALTEVTAAVLPGMVERGKGAVVNIGSGSGSLLPSYPLYSVYGATKRYAADFSRSLAVEYRGRGIDVQCQAPMLVETNMVSDAVKGSVVPQFVLAPDAYARDAVHWIGRGTLCVPSVAYRIQAWAISLSPDFSYDAHILEKHLRQRDIFRRLRQWRANSQGSSRNGSVVVATQEDKSGNGVSSKGPPSG